MYFMHLIQLSLTDFGCLFTWCLLFVGDCNFCSDDYIAIFCHM